MLAGDYTDGKLDIAATQDLPHSLGLLYEGVTEQLGFARSSDECKVMALASYGNPVHVDWLRQRVHWRWIHASETAISALASDGVDPVCRKTLARLPVWQLLPERRCGQCVRPSTPTNHRSSTSQMSSPTR